MSKISELSDGGVIQGGDTLIAVRSGGNVKVTYGGSTTANIDGGTIDGTTIGGTTPAAGSFTTLQANTSLNVDGTVTADGLTVDVNSGSAEFIDLGQTASDAPQILIGNGDTSARSGLIRNYNDASNFEIIASASVTADKNLVFRTVDNASESRLKIANNGDISFYEDTGTTAKLFWDASAESLELSKLTALGDQNTKLAFSPANTVRLFTGGLERFRLDSSGNVGIGTSSPSALGHIYKSGAESKLLVEGDGAGASAKIEIDGHTTAQLDLTYRSNTSSKTASLIHQTSGDLAINTLSVERMRIDSSGNVGIGVTNVGAPLDIGTSNPKLRLTDSDGGYSEVRGNGGVITLTADAGNAVANSAIAFETDGSEAMRIASGGNVGIGATPDSHYTGYTAVDLGVSSSIFGNTTTADTNALGLANNAYLNSNATNWIYKETDEATRYTQSNGTHTWHYAASGTAGTAISWSEAMRIDSSGNLIVSGTSSGDATSVALHNGGYVHAVSSHQMAGIFDRRDSDGDILIFRRGASTQVGSIGTGGGDLNIGTGDTRIRFNDATDNLVPLNASNGYRDDAVSLGDSTARFKDLHLSGVAYIAGTTGRGLKISNATESYTNNVAVLDAQHSQGILQFKTAGSEAARIDKDGNLLVGTTSSTAGITATSGGALVYRPNKELTVSREGSGSSSPVAIFNQTGDDGQILDFRKDGTTVGTISVTASATAYNTSSDERLKENIANADDAGSKIDAIQVRKFDWKADGSHQDYGMIAQELNAVAPEAVTEGDTEEDMMSVDYSKLVPMLVKEIQSLRARVAELESN